MRILLIGDYSLGGTTRTFQAVFDSIGHAVAILDEWQLYRSGSRLAKNRYVHHFFWWLLAIPFQNALIAEVVKNKPEMILIFKGWLIKPSTLKKLKKVLPGAILFNFNGDNPFNTWAHGNSNSWIRNSIPLYDAYFIWGEFLRKPILDAGAKRFEYLPCGYDPKLHYKVEAKNEGEKKYFGSSIAFIGTYDKEREYWLEQLLDFDLKIWGNSWEKASKELQGKWQKREVVGEDFSKVCNSAKIILNFVRKQNGSAHNMRTFEVPACGGFILATRTSEQGKFFEEGKEMDFFSTPEELRQKINFYLENEEKRVMLANAAHTKILGMKATYSDRAGRILEVYQDIKSNKINPIEQIKTP